jgi:hypothetical protein
MCSRRTQRIDGDIHNPIMELSPEDRWDRAKVNEAVRAVSRKPEMQYLNRVGRRIIMFMMLIGALAAGKAAR